MLKNLFYPLDKTLERAYWKHQLAVVSTPLKFATVVGSIILWTSIVLVPRGSLGNSTSNRYWLAAGIQFWLILMFITLNSVGRARYVAVVTTPLFPAIVTYFMTLHVIPHLNSVPEMTHAYPILIILIIAFYALDTISTLGATFSGVSTSFALYYGYSKNLHMAADNSVFFIIHLILANAMGFVININTCYTSRMQFKLARVAEKDREIVDSLIKRVFPESIGKELKAKGANLARGYKNVTLILADIANFTQITTTLEPKQLVTLLHELFHRFDRLADQHGVEKIKTIGDAYMAAAGCPVQIKNHAQRTAFFALELLKLIKSFNKQFNTDFSIRIGIHTGSVVGGVISGKRISFDIWGETVNLTSRLQNVAEPGEIIVSDETTKILRGDFVISEFRMVDLKGLGPTPVARLISSHEKNSFLAGRSKPDSQLRVSELPFLSQH